MQHSVHQGLFLGCNNNVSITVNLTAFPAFSNSISLLCLLQCIVPSGSLRPLHCGHRDQAEDRACRAPAVKLKFQRVRNYYLEPKSSMGHFWSQCVMWHVPSSHKVRCVKWWTCMLTCSDFFPWSVFLYSYRYSRKKKGTVDKPEVGNHKASTNSTGQACPHSR